jgi:hypothetical protein
MKSRLAGWPPPLIYLRIASNGGELAAGRYSGNSVEYSHKKPLQIANARQSVQWALEEELLERSDCTVYRSARLVGKVGVDRNRAQR